MIPKPLKVGNAQAFWGDRPGAAFHLVSQQPDLNFVTLDYLAEVSMSIMAIQREKDFQLGYAQDFIQEALSLVPLWQAGSQVKVVTNAGGLNPVGCAERLVKEFQKLNVYKTIGVVYGDDVLGIMKNRSSEITANAYLGAEGIVEVLKKGADIVITGRIADPSLTLAPCRYHFGWNEDQYDLLAAGTIAGHLIECGTQVTGGIATDWLTIEDVVEIGYPVVEMNADGTFIVTKAKGTGGCVNEQTVKEQLLYEIGNPERYLSPDVTVSFLDLSVKDLEENRVLVKGAKGSAPPETLKVSATFMGGFKCEGFLAVVGKDAEKKARRAGEIVLERLEHLGLKPERSLIECLGTGDIVKGALPHISTYEVLLRIAIADSRIEVMERFSKEIAPLVTSGPQGVTGYTSGRPKPIKLFRYQAQEIPKQWVRHQTRIFRSQE